MCSQQTVDFLKSTLYANKFIYFYVSVTGFFFFFLPPDRGFMNELMFTSARYYLAEMTGFSLLYSVRSKKHISFKEKN